MPKGKHARDKASSKSLGPTISKRMSSKSVSLTLSKEGLIKPGEKKGSASEETTQSHDLTEKIEERKSKAELSWKLLKKSVHPVGVGDGSKTHSISVSAPAPTPATAPASPAASATTAAPDAAPATPTTPASGSQSSAASAASAHTPPKEGAAEGDGDGEAGKRSRQAVRKAVLRAALAQARKAQMEHVSLGVDDSVRERVVEEPAKEEPAAAPAEPPPPPLPELVLKAYLQRRMQARVSSASKPAPQQLTALEATACISPLLNAADRLLVCKGRLPMIMHDKRRTAYKSLSKRFAEYEGTIKSAEGEERKFLKMVQKERIFTEEVLRKTARDLLNRHYKSLHTAVSDFDRQLCEEEEMLRQKTLLKHLLQQMTMARRRELQRQEVAERADSNSSYTMRDELCALQLELETRCRYIGHWETARRAQHRLRINRRLKTLETQVETRRREVAHEMAFYSQMSKLHKLETAKLEKEMKAWQHKFEQDSEEITNAIMHKNVDLDMLRYQCDSASKELDFRAHQLEAYHSAKLTLLVQTAAALTLQEWWRGVLYRRLVASSFATMQKARAAYAALLDTVKREGIAGPKVEKRKQAVRDAKERLKELQVLQKEEHMRLALVQVLGALLALLQRTKERTKNWSREDKARARAQALAAAERVAQEHILRALALANVRPSSSELEEEEEEYEEYEEEYEEEEIEEEEVSSH